MTGTCGCPEDERRGLSTLTRRGVLKAVGAVTTALAVGPAVDLAGAGPAQAATNGVLVVVSLRGGADGLTMFPPVGDPHYASSRPGTAVPASRATRLDSTFGLHPQLAPLLPHWRGGRMALVQGVGGPAHSRSHFDSVVAMEQASFGAGVRTGWLDRLLGTIGASTLYGGVTMGNARPAAMAGPRPTLTVSSIGTFRLSIWEPVLASYQSTLRALHQHSGAVSAGVGPSLSAMAGFQAASNRAPAPANGARYPTGGLGTELRDIARLLRGGLPVRVAHVEVGGYDVHSGLGAAGGVDSGTMHTLLAELGLALAAFATDLGPALLSRVTILTTTEFGRRVVQNGSGGVDHGRGNAMMLLGAGVNGGRSFGRWPTLAPDRLDGGDLAVTTDYRSVLAEVVTDRFGLGSSALATVFPGFRPVPLGVTRTT